MNYVCLNITKNSKQQKQQNEKGFIWGKISDKHCEKYPYRSRRACKVKIIIILFLLIDSISTSHKNQLV